LIVSPLRAEEMPARVSILQEAVQESLPLVELTDLLIEKVLTAATKLIQPLSQFRFPEGRHR
jgi:hypothetical protein